MQNLCLTILRFAIAAWVGAAVLFVVISVREVGFPRFDSETKSELALLRFPAYYACGFTLVATALISGLIASIRSAGRRPRLSICLGLLATALLIMLIDYVWIYSPLREMTKLVSAARPASFATYHSLSTWVNAVDISICLAAALLVCWPDANRVH